MTILDQTAFIAFDEARDLDRFPGTGTRTSSQARIAAVLGSGRLVRARRVYAAMLEHSAQIQAGNFTVIGSDDLNRMFALYDREFFRGLLGEMLMEDYAHPMAFRLSRRLTRAAGQTMRQVRRVPVAGRMAERVEYEISVSTTLLFSTFQNVEREVIVGGLLCHDRLEALQRIFEHELLHLAEFLGWVARAALPRTSTPCRGGSSPTRVFRMTWSRPASRPRSRSTFEWAIRSALSSRA